MMSKKCLGYISLLMIVMMPAQAASEQAIQNLRAAIEQSDKIRVQELLLKEHFTQEELQDAYDRALIVYNQKNTMVGRTAEALLSPARVGAFLMAVGCGLGAALARMHIDMLMTSVKCLEGPASARTLFFKAKLAGLERSPKPLLFPQMREEVIERYKDMILMSEHERTALNFIHTDIGLNEKKCKILAYAAVVSAVAACLFAYMQPSLKDVLDIVVAIEAKMNQNKNK